MFQAVRLDPNRLQTRAESRSTSGLVAPLASSTMRACRRGAEAARHGILQAST
jgi:hypothetical protein